MCFQKCVCGLLLDSADKLAEITVNNGQEIYKTECGSLITYSALCRTMLYSVHHYIESEKSCPLVHSWQYIHGPLIMQASKAVWNTEPENVSTHMAPSQVLLLNIYRLTCVWRHVSVISASLVVLGQVQQKQDKNSYWAMVTVTSIERITT